MSLRIAYCVFPSSPKEYAYFCPFADAKVGDRATVQTGTAIITRFTKTLDGKGATRSIIYVERPDPQLRKKQIETRLLQIEANYTLADRFKKLAARDPEAKRLVAEYKRLAK